MDVQVREKTLFSQFYCKSTENLQEKPIEFKSDRLFKDGDGYISCHELKEFFHNIGEMTLTDDDVMEMIRQTLGYVIALSLNLHLMAKCIFSFYFEPFRDTFPGDVIR